MSRDVSLMREDEPIALIKWYKNVFYHGITATMHDTVEDIEKGRRDELAAFLRSMRARVRPEEAGLAPGSRRRVKGLRREEVARLAAISTTWYVWLEQGRDVTPSAGALERLARALRLNHVEQSHLFRLARPVERQPASAGFAARVPSPALRALVDGLHPRPAYVLDPLWDVTAWNEAAARLLCGFPGDNDAGSDRTTRNVLLRMFLDETWRQLFENWEFLAASVVAQFRAATSELNSYPEHRRIVETLRERSPKFAALWQQIELAHPQSCQKTLRHPTVGRMTFNYTTLACEGDDRGCWISIYTPAAVEDQAALDELLAK